MNASGGLGWADTYEVFYAMGPQYAALFLFFIIFVVYAFLNIITGIFVQRSFKVLENDTYFKLCEDHVEKRRYEQNVRKLFTVMDSDNDQTITLEEFKASLKQHEVQMYFNWMGIDVSKATQIFKL